MHDRAAPGAHQHLLLGQLVEVTPDGGGGDRQLGGGLLDVETAALDEQFQQGLPAGVARHPRLRSSISRRP